MPPSALHGDSGLVGFQLACYSAENKLRKAPGGEDRGGRETQYVVQRPGVDQHGPGGGHPTITWGTPWLGTVRPMLILSF